MSRDYQVRREERHTVNDQRSPRKEDRRHLVRVRSEFLASHNTIEDQTCVRKTAGLDSQWCNGTSVFSVGSTQPRKSRVVVGAICRPVLVLGSNVSAPMLDTSQQGDSESSSLRERGVRHILPELIKESVGQVGAVLGVRRETGNELDNTLHQVGLVVGQLTRCLVLHDIHQGAVVLEAQSSQVLEGGAGLIVAMLQVGAVAALSWQWAARGMDHLGVLLKDLKDIIAGSTVVFRDLRSSRLCEYLGLSLAIGLSIGNAILLWLGFVLPLEGTRKATHHDGN